MLHIDQFIINLRFRIEEYSFFKIPQAWKPSMNLYIEIGLSLETLIYLFKKNIYLFIYSLFIWFVSYLVICRFQNVKEDRGALSREKIGKQYCTQFI